MSFRTSSAPWHESPTGIGLSRELASSPAGPLADDATGPAAPIEGAGRLRQSVRLVNNSSRVFMGGYRRHGDVFAVNSMLSSQPVVVTSHPDHIRSLFTADPDIAPSLAGESPLRPVVGESVLTAVGERHKRQRKLLMPAFHGDAIARYREQIAEATQRELGQWPIGRPFALTEAAQTITLDVILAGIFGIDHLADEAEHLLRRRIQKILALSTSRVARVSEFANGDRKSPIGPQKWIFDALDRVMYKVIAKRRAEHEPGARHDVLALLLDARDESGEALTDTELRDELLTLVLAGHETTANSIAWTFERLLRTPDTYDRLRDSVRSGDDSDDYLMATIHESMRVRPVVPTVGRRVLVPWQLGGVVAPARTRVLISILVAHHREDLYDDPFSFEPQRFVGVRPGTYTWMPFGGGNRRCLGAALAMEEMRTVVGEIARRVDLTAPDSAPERPRHRNVTMIPERGGQVIAQSISPR